jgi:hypothetical protein
LEYFGARDKLYTTAHRVVAWTNPELKVSAGWPIPDFWIPILANVGAKLPPSFTINEVSNFFALLFDSGHLTWKPFAKQHPFPLGNACLCVDDHFNMPISYCTTMSLQKISLNISFFCFNNHIFDIQAPRIDSARLKLMIADNI